MTEIPVVRVLFYEPSTPKVYNGDDNLSEEFFSSHEKAINYVRTRRLKVRRIVESRLPKGDPRIDKYDKMVPG